MKVLSEDRCWIVVITNEAVYKTAETHSHYAILADDQFECDDDEEEAK